MDVESGSRPLLDDDATFSEDGQRRIHFDSDPYARVRRNESIDDFFTNVYEYYAHGGFRAYAINKIGYFVKLVFTIGLGVFLFGCVDYEKLWHALDELQPNSNSHYSQHVELSEFISFVGFSWWAWILLLVSIAYTIVTAFRVYLTVKSMLRIHDFYTITLGVRHLATTEWPEIVARIKSSNVVPQNESVASLLAHRILRRQNYQIALIESGALGLDVGERTVFTRPWNPLMQRTTASGLADDDDDNYYYSRSTNEIIQPVYTKTFEWAMHNVLFDFIFDADTGTLRPELTSSDDHVLESLSKLLAERSKRFAGAFLFASPFVLIYMITDFFLQHGDTFRSQPQTFCMRTWSNDAKWKFRSYNELPHFFARRMARSYKPAQLYIANFTSPTMSALAKLASYCAASCLAVLFFFGLLYDDDVLTRVDLMFGRSGMWWVGMLTAVVAVSRAIIPTENAVFRPKHHLQRVAEHTKYYPNAWQRREHSAVVRADFQRLFGARWWFSLRELFSVIYTPYLLYFVVPLQTKKILKFVVNNTSNIDDIGFVCSRADFKQEAEHSETKVEQSRLLFAEQYADLSSAGFGDSDSDSLFQ